MNTETGWALEMWTREHKEHTKHAPLYFDECMMIMSGTGWAAHFIGYKGYIYYEESLLHTTELTPDLTDRNDFVISFDSDEVQDKHQVIGDIWSTYLSANAYLTYGNIDEDRYMTAQGRNVGEDKVITFKLNGDKLETITTRSHKSPEGEFGVRGHYRRYKSGKVVWIDAYKKGTKKQ